MENSKWTEVLLPLLTLALRLEADGQYNLAKLARAAVDSLSRQAAYRENLTAPRQALDKEVEQVIEALSGLDAQPAPGSAAPGSAAPESAGPGSAGPESAGLLAAFRQGNTALSAGRIPSILETPHPYVCRTCGHMILGAVTEKCPTCGAWPDTFQRFPPIYWLEALDPPEALEKLRQTPLEVAALLDGLSEQDMAQEPEDGGWSIRNILIHLRDAQDVLDYRLELFSKEDHPILEAKAVWSWAKNEDSRPPTSGEIFEAYKATRAKIIAQLERLPLIDWWRTGQHEEFGIVSIKQQASYFASHERTHLPQLERLRNFLQDGMRREG